jgi:hypothetical protein
VHFVVEPEDLEDADATAVAGAAAAVAADGGFEFRDQIGLCRVAAKNGKVFEELDLRDRRRLRTFGAQAADEALGDDKFDG